MSDDKNYITPVGYKRLRDEYAELLNVERPKIVETVAWAASNGDRSENADYIYGKRRLREIDSRLRFLQGRLEKAVVVDPKQLTGSKVVFGATVTVLDEQEIVHTYQIVGQDEFDIKNGKISWKSPVAKALLGKTRGDEVKVAKPGGDEYITIEAIEFK
ncbi:MAG: transcription elongation factor GreB [Bdellovibrionaceae bacterium]|nr:transcription elongation factor GreB [Pseudobdellovibrionaceae bacterium]